MENINNKILPTANFDFKISHFWYVSKSSFFYFINSAFFIFSDFSTVCRMTEQKKRTISVNYLIYCIVYAKEFIK